MSFFIITFDTNPRTMATFQTDRIRMFDENRAEKNINKEITASKSYTLAAATQAASIEPADDDVAEYTLLRKLFIVAIDIGLIDSSMILICTH